MQKILSNDGLLSSTLRPMSAPEKAYRCLPGDCTLLPLHHGQLVVSPAHAVFCPVPPGECEQMAAVLAGKAGLEALSAELLDNLDRHGFFGEPRKPEDDPPTVQLQLTNDCNLTCSYCCTNSGKPRPNEVGLEGFQEVVREIGEVFGLGTRVAILGGEPLLIPWATELGEHILEAGLTLVLFTNGLLIAQDDALAERVAALAKRGAEIRISLAGATAERCDAVSGAGRFASVIAAIEALASHGAGAVLDLMLLPDDVSDVSAHLPELRRQLPSDTTLSLGVLYRSGREEGAHMFTSHQGLETALDRVALEAGEKIPAPVRRPVTYRREGCDCAMGKSLNVRSDGSLFTCFKMEERIGNLAQESFSSVVKRFQAAPQRAALLPLCAECALNTLCGGGCRAENFVYTGDADTPVCGPWRIRVLSELLAEDRVFAVDWPVPHLLEESRRRGLETPETLAPVRPSSHLIT